MCDSYQVSLAVHLSRLLCPSCCPSEPWPWWGGALRKRVVEAQEVWMEFSCNLAVHYRRQILWCKLFVWWFALVLDEVFLWLVCSGNFHWGNNYSEGVGVTLGAGGSQFLRQNTSDVWGWIGFVVKDSLSMWLNLLGWSSGWDGVRARDLC